MIYATYAIHTLICIFLILVVLLQSGKGADLSVFGGGSTQTFFGARGATTLLHKLTVGSFVVFILTTVAIAILQGQQEKASVMSGVEQTQPATSEPAPATPATTPAAVVPTEVVPVEVAPAEAVPAEATSAPPAAATEDGGSPAP